MVYYQYHFSVYCDDSHHLAFQLKRLVPPPIFYHNGIMIRLVSLHMSPYPEPKHSPCLDLKIHDCDDLKRNRQSTIRFNNDCKFTLITKNQIVD